MALPATIEENLEQTGIGPAEVEKNGHKVKQHPLPDLIAADKYLNAKEQPAVPFRLRMNKISPPGAA